MTNEQIHQITLESLRDWFKKEKWVRISSSGEIAGPCGTSKNKKNPDRCLPKAKAQSLTKGQRAATAAKKKKAGAKGKTVVKNTKAATVKKETANPQDGKAAPYGSGYKPIKKMKEEKTISQKQVVKIKDMIKSLKKSSKGHAGQADYLAKLVKETFKEAIKANKKENLVYTDSMTKEKLLDLMKNSDDAMIQTSDGREYVVYNPNSNNKDNADMWHDESVFALDSDGGEHEIDYRDIVSVDAYDVDETKEAPAGHYFTKSGNLVKGRMSADAKERGARKSDPKDKQRSKVPPVSQYNEEVFTAILEKCWKGYEKKGMKTMFGKRVPNCVKKEDIKNLVVGILHEMNVDEKKKKKKKKNDRCTRRAKREFDTWPSAYASGAVVRCRRGEIWKKK